MTRIQLAQKANENEMMIRIRKANKEGKGYAINSGVLTDPMYNALGRLEVAGKITFRKARRAWDAKQGYWAN